MQKKYSIIYVDPPWDYKGQLQHTIPNGGNTGGAITHYPTITVKEMSTWRIGDRLADSDCLLFMWTSSPHLDQAIELGIAWGFKYTTVAFVWNKMRVNPGYYTMSECELCLVFKKGKIPQPRGARNVRQLVNEKRNRHSKKPIEVRKRIEQMFPTQEKIELFAREATKGWAVWGNEVESDIELETIGELDA